MTQLLIENARVDATNAFGNTPLHVVFPDEKSLEKVKFVLDSKPQAVNLKNKGGLTPLDKANQKGDVELAKLLQDRGGVKAIAHCTQSRSNPAKAKRKRTESFCGADEAYGEGKLTQAFEKLGITRSKQPRQEQSTNQSSIENSVNLT